MPIRGQHPGHVSTLDQSEASIRSCDLSLVCDISQKRKIKFSNNCHIFNLGVKIHVLNPRPVSVGQSRSRAIFPGVWLVTRAIISVINHHLISPINSCNSCNKFLQILQYYIVVIVLIHHLVYTMYCTVLYYELV